MATFVKKIIVGTPVKRVTAGSFDISNLGGVNISGDAGTGYNTGEGQHNDLLVYDSAAGEYRNLQTLRVLKVDNFTFDSNQISLSQSGPNSLQELYVNAPNGTFFDGKVEADRYIQTQLAAFTDSALTTKFYVDQEVRRVKELTFETDDGFIDSVQLYDGETIKTIGGNGITTTGAKINLQYQQTISLDSTGAVAGSYGSSIRIPVLNINHLGQVDSITDVAVASLDSISYDSSLASGVFSINTSDGGLFQTTINLNPFTTNNLVEGPGEGPRNLAYTLNASDNNNYIVTGDATGNDPEITVRIGDTLTFTNLAINDHPMFIKTIPGDGLGDGVPGVTGQGTGTVTWTPTAAGTYYYQCVNHAGMVGTITVTNPFEGNLYYTRDRFDSALGDNVSIQTIRGYVGATGDLQYDSATGVFSVDVQQVYGREDFDSDLDDAMNSNANLHWYPASNFFDLTAINDSTAGTYGSPTQMPVFSVDSYGRIDSIGEVLVASVDSTRWLSDTNTFRISTGDGQVFNTIIDSFNSNVLIKDDIQLKFGNNDDLVIYHDNGSGTNFLTSQDELRLSSNMFISLVAETQVTGDLLPTADSSFDLGSPTNRWKDLHLSGQSIYLGTVKLADSNGSLSIQNADGQPGSLALRYLDADSAHISQLSVDSINVAQIEIDSAYLNNINVGTADIDVGILGQITIDSAYITQVNISQADVDSLYADTLNVDTADIDNGTFGQVTIDSAYITQLNVVTGDIDTLTSADAVLDSAYIGQLNVSQADVDSLYADQINISQADIDSAHISQLNIDSAYATQINVSQADIDSLYVDQINASQVNIDSLYADQLNAREADLDSLHANTLNVVTADIDNGVFGQVTIDSVYATQLNVGTADIDVGVLGQITIDSAYITQINASQADIDSLYADTLNVVTADIDNGTFGQLTIDSAHVTSMDGVDIRFDSGRIDTFSADIIEADSVSVGFVKFDQVAWDDNVKPSNIEGAVYYNSGPDALVYKPASASPVKIGQDEVTRVYNNSGVTIAKGTPVYVTGASNDFPTIGKAQADDISTISATIGVAKDSIDTGDFGLILERGLIGRLDTSAFSVGDTLYVSADSEGKFVTTAPVFPNFAYEIGRVLVSDSAGGAAVGGCIQIDQEKDFFEALRVTGNGRIDNNLTIGGNLSVLGTQTQTSVQSLAVADTIIELGAGNTIGPSTIFAGTGDQNATLIGHYTGDSNKVYHVRVQTSDVAGDTLQWSFEGDYSVLEPFDSAGGPTSFVLTDGDLIAGLAYGISISVDNKSGHDVGDSWQGDAAPIDVQIGIIGNYNPPDDSHAYSGLIRDPSDDRWKFFQQYLPEPAGNVNTSDPSFEFADIQVKNIFASNVTAAVTGNVTGTVSDISNHTTTNLLEGTNLYYTDARVRAAIADSAVAVRFDADSGQIKQFVADSAFITQINASQVDIDSLYTDTLNVITADIDNGTFGQITIDSAYITQLNVVTADIDNGTFGQVTIDSAYITQLNTSQADIDSLYTDTLNVNLADINTFTADSAIITSISGDSAVFVDIVRSNSPAVAGTYGTASLVPIITIDGSGFVDSVGTVAVAGVTGFAWDSNTSTATISTADGASFPTIINGFGNNEYLNFGNNGGELKIRASGSVGTIEVDNPGGILTLSANSKINLSAQTNVDGDLLPEQDSAYDLGSTTKKWKDLHLSGQSIFLGSLVMRDSGGNMAVHGPNQANVEFRASRGMFDSAVIGQLSVDSINVGQIDIDSAYFNNINSSTIDFDNMTGDSSRITNLSGSTLNFTNITRAGATSYAGTYGSASLIPVLTVDSSGFIDSIGTVTVAGVTDFTFDSSNGNLTISTADGQSFVATSTLDPFTTTNLVEGNNLYYTSTRVDSDIDFRVDKSFVDNLNINADKLDGLDASQFLRSDADTTLNGELVIVDGLNVNSDSNGDWQVSHNTVQRLYDNRDSNNLTPGIDQDSNNQGLINIYVRTDFKTGAHRYWKQGSSKGYYIAWDSDHLYTGKEVQAPHLDILPGVTYRFHHNDSSMLTHDIRFYWDDAKNGLVSDSAADITYVGSAGSPGSYSQIKVKDYGPRSLAYQCINHPYMGNSINTNTTGGSRMWGTSDGIFVDGLIEGIIDGGTY